MVKMCACRNYRSSESDETAQEHLDELEFLATTAGAQTIKQFQIKFALPPTPKLMSAQGNSKRLPNILMKIM